MSVFDPVEEDEMIYVVEDPEAARKEMEENDGKFSGNLIPVIKNPKIFKLIILDESQDCINVWQEILDKIKQSKIGVKKDIYDRTSKWKKRNFKYFAAIFNTKSGDSPVMALLSRDNKEHKYFINLITTNSPLMSQPFVSMLLGTLDEVLTQQGSGIIIPKEYLPSNMPPMEVASDKGLTFDDDGVLVTRRDPEQSETNID